MKLRTTTIAVALLISGTAQANILESVFGTKEYKTTLEKIKATGKVVIGVRGSSIPLSYLDAQGQPKGYAHDLSTLAIIPEIEKKVGRKVSVEVQEITPATRIQLISTGKVDFECTSTTNTAERRKQVNFSHDFYQAGLAIMSDKTVFPQVRFYTDLMSKEVIVVSGTTGQKFLENKNAYEGYNTTLIKVKDNAEALLLMEQKRASLFLQDDILEAGVRAKSARASDFVISKYSGETDRYGCMSKLGDTEMASTINEAIVKWAKSGKMEQSYTQWFTKPLPGSNLNMNWPMSLATANAVNELKAK